MFTQETDGVAAYISAFKLLVLAILVQFAVHATSPAGEDRMNSSHGHGRLGWLQTHNKADWLWLGWCCQNRSEEFPQHLMSTQLWEGASQMLVEIDSGDIKPVTCSTEIQNWIFLCGQRTFCVFTISTSVQAARYRHDLKPKCVHFCISVEAGERCYFTSIKFQRLQGIYIYIFFFPYKFEK